MTCLNGIGWDKLLRKGEERDGKKERALRLSTEPPLGKAKNQKGEGKM